jgi:protein-disulfide isomerase
MARLSGKLVLEYLAYSLLVVGAAFAARAFVAPPSATSQAMTKPRSPADAQRLMAYLHLERGVPAVVEFMDFECPPCRMSWPKLEQFRSKHPGVVYRAVNFPLPMHTNAFPAAVASEIARAHGKYEVTFSALFSGRCALDKDSLNRYLLSIGAPAIVGSKAAAPFEHLVKADQAFAGKFGVNATPTFFVVSGKGTLTEVRSVVGLDQANI